MPATITYIVEQAEVVLGVAVDVTATAGSKTDEQLIAETDAALRVELANRLKSKRITAYTIGGFALGVHRDAGKVIVSGHGVIFISIAGQFGNL